MFCYEYDPCTTVVRYLVNNKDIYGEFVYPKDLELYIETVMRLMRGE
jgi:hypothetical protein